MIQIKSDKKAYGINFPSNVSEIKNYMLEAITKDVKLPKYHAIVALCFRTKLFDLVAMASSTNKDQMVSVTPLLAKIGEEDAKICNVEVGNKVIVDRSTLERGVHLNLPTMISSTNARNYFADDKELSKAIMTKTPGIVYNTNPVEGGIDNVIVLEFKIIPCSSINASISLDAKAIDPWVLKVSSAG